MAEVASLLHLFIYGLICVALLLVVLGETEPSVRDILFGTVQERIVTATDVPVIVVRHEDPDVQSAEQSMEAASS